MKRYTIQFAGIAIALTFYLAQLNAASIVPVDWAEAENYFVEEKTRLKEMPNEQLREELQTIERMIDARENVLGSETKEVRLKDPQLMKWNMVRNYIVERLGLEEQEDELY